MKTNVQQREDYLTRNQVVIGLNQINAFDIIAVWSTPRDTFFTYAGIFTCRRRQPLNSHSLIVDQITNSPLKESIDQKDFLIQDNLVYFCPT